MFEQIVRDIRRVFPGRDPSLVGRDSKIGGGNWVATAASNGGRAGGNRGWTEEYSLRKTLFFDQVVPIGGLFSVVSIYRRNRPSASGLDPEAVHGRTVAIGTRVSVRRGGVSRTVYDGVYQCHHRSCRIKRVAPLESSGDSQQHC